MFYTVLKKNKKNPNSFFIFQMETNQTTIEVKVAELCPMCSIMNNSLF